MMSRPGVDTTKAPGRCMVVGCKGKALYRNPGKWYRARGCQGGYCSEHRHFAQASPSTQAEGERVLDSYLQKREGRNL